jgi:O-antigen/teichoic acid export membrane protein
MCGERMPDDCQSTAQANAMNEDLSHVMRSISRRRVGVLAYLGTFGTNVVIQGFAVVQGIIIARLLGPTGRGEYAAVVLWPSVFAALGIFGTNTALARAAARTDQGSAITRTAVSFALITSAISGLLCYFCLPHLLPGTEQHLLGLSKVFVPFIVLNHLALNLLALDQGTGNFRRFNLTRLALYPVYVAFLVVMLIRDIRQVKWAAIGLLSANLAVVVVRLLWVAKDLIPWRRLYCSAEMVRDSIHFGLVGAAMPLHLQADKAILLWLLGTKDLGLYTVALSASLAMACITSAAGMVSFTVATQAGQGQGFETLATTFRISALLWLVGGSILAAVMPFLLPLVYGVEFAPAVNPARLLIVGSALAGLANLLDQAMRGQGRAFIGLEGRVAGLAAIVALGSVLARQWGLIGMCLAFVAGQLVCLSVFVYCAIRHYGQGMGVIRALVIKWSDVGELLSRVRIGWEGSA